MAKPTQFFHSFRALAFVVSLAAPMLPWPGLICSAVAGETPVGAALGARFYSLADVNGDGRADLIYTFQSGWDSPQTNVYVQYSNGTSFGAPVVVATDSSVTREIDQADGNSQTQPEANILAVGDVNGDGKPDILFGNGTIALGNGSGFGPHAAWGAALGARFYSLADVNGDGRADLIYTFQSGWDSPQTNVYVQYSNGTSFGAPVVVATDSSVTREIDQADGNSQTQPEANILAVGDVNGDGKPDILFGNGTIALGNGSGFGPHAAWSYAAVGPTFNTLVDVDGDGRADLIYTLQSGSGTPQTNVYVQYSDGTKFKAPIVVATDSSYTREIDSADGGVEYQPEAKILAVGDVNGDGHLEVLFANGSVSSLHFFTVFPSYQIGSVVYAPPGSGSTVGYSDQTVTGTTVSTEQTWSHDSSESIGFRGITVSFGDSFGGSTTHTVDQKETILQGQTYPGPPQDGINHDYDRVIIFLGVQVHASADFLGNVTSQIDFSNIPDFSKPPAEQFSQNGYAIQVGCLRGTFDVSTCSDLLNFLNMHGVTTADYPAILCADPFADPSCAPPGDGRYVFLVSKGYSNQQGTQNFSSSNALTITDSNKTSYSHNVGVEAASPPDPTIPMKFTDKFTWTYSSTTTTTTGNTATGSFNILPPSPLYQGFNNVFVWVDTIFKTFRFTVQ